MIQFSAVLHRYEQNADKTGWTYLVIPPDVADQINPGIKKMYKVKGKLDSFAISKVSIMPMGGGQFMMPINAVMRKALGKRKGSLVTLRLSLDKSVTELNQELLQCLADEPKAEKTFQSFTNSTRNWISKWVGTAKTEQTKAKRIAMIVMSCERSRNADEFIIAFREVKKEQKEVKG